MSSQSAEEPAEPPVEQLRDQTGADPGLTPEERETTFSFAVDEDSVRIHSEEAAIIRRLLSHEAFEPARVGVHNGETTRTVSFAEAADETGPDDRVVRVRGRLPLRFLNVASVGRNHNQHAPIVSEEVFADDE
ncbi:hypothetical protein [Halorubrum sp. Atlit-26R]|uniref:hypothetical protein n=1 Tax=Halorubrum sp. Atlit-26R TaxID=2282128 RepID=UPI000EF24B33|nr:hypothetical protein [Halorubrum sp. Atlit-26R]RLM62553.1 hypothetical protein DVK07_18580 [Halorubrum sp. Atlit-26R]